MRQHTLFAAIVAAIVLLGLPARAQLLWRVSGNGLERPSYIMGTHHLALPSMLDSISGFADALAASGAVWGEVDCDSMASPQVMQRMAMAMMAPPDSALSHLLSADGYAVVERTFNKYFGPTGLSLKQLDALKPAAIATQMQVLRDAANMGNWDPSQQIDAEVQRRARAAGKAVHGLEDIDFQIGLLLGAPLTVQASDLLEMCKRDSAYAALSAEIGSAYERQDLDRLQRLIEDEELAGDSREAQRLIYDRNASWVSTLPAAMARGPVLVCVGAGHLPGAKGLIAMLRGKGFTVAPFAGAAKSDSGQ